MHNISSVGRPKSHHVIENRKKIDAFTLLSTVFIESF